MYRKTAALLTCVVAVVVILGLCSGASAGGKSEAALMRMSLPEVCRYMGIPCDYDFRMDFVLMLFRHGITLFEGASSTSSGYGGSSGENARLARNIMFNRRLFVNGVLPAENVKKWRVVY